MNKLNLKVVVILLFTSLQMFALDRPNILWIVTDDQRADALSCYNQAVYNQSNSPLGYVESPCLDALAKEGVLFTETFCNSPACAPSRGSMQTGKYPFRSGIYGFEQTHLQADHCDPTVPEVMRSQGYKASQFGKSGFYIFDWGPGLTWNDPGIYEFRVDMKNNLQKYGFTDFYKPVSWEGGKKVTKEAWYYPDGTIRSYSVATASGEIPEADQQERRAIEAEHDVFRSYTRDNTQLIFAGVSSQPGSKTLDGRITESVQNYLSNINKIYTTLDGRKVEGPKNTQPQFVHIGYHFPHTPVLPPKSFRDRFKDKTYAIPDFTEAELSKLPSRLISLYTKMKISDMTYEEKQETIRNYYAFCAFGDSLIGEAVASFKDYCRKNSQEYLIVIACGDHGWHLGEQGISAKFGPYDMLNHTSMIVVSSNKSKFPENTVEDSYAEYVDFAPTFFAAAGLDVDSEEFDYLDGYDLAKVISKEKEPRDYVLGCMNHVIGDRSYIRSKDFAFSMITRKGWNKPKESDILKDVKWPMTTTRKNAEMALYDLRVDPMEQSNVAYDEKYIALADWFREKAGNIFLGDGRVECDWSLENVWAESNFAKGADDKKLDIPASLIPTIEESTVELDSISFETTAIEISVGETLYIIPKYHPFDASNKALNWKSDNESIVTVNNGIINGVEPGETAITVTTGDASQISKELIITVLQGTVGFNKQEFENENIRIFPNPANNQLTITGLNQSNHTYCSLYSYNGVKVFSQKIMDNQDELLVDVSEFPQGMYIVKFHPDSDIHTSKLLVQ